MQRRQQRQRQQRQQLERQQVQQRQEPMRQQQELVQELQQVLVQELVLLLSYRKRPEQLLQRSLPKRVICSFFDSLMNMRKQFSGNGPTKSSRSIVQAGELELFQPNWGVYPYKPTDEQQRLPKLSKLVQIYCLNGTDGPPSSGLRGSTWHQPARIQPVSQEFASCLTGLA